MNKKAYKQMLTYIKQNCEERTNSLRIGDVYFLSSFHDQKGAFVEVLSKSTKENYCGWPSSVEVKVVETVTDKPDSFHEKHYAVGTVHTVNASNLYDTREEASHKAKFPSAYKE